MALTRLETLRGMYIHVNPAVDTQSITVFTIYIVRQINIPEQTVNSNLTNLVRIYNITISITTAGSQMILHARIQEFSSVSLTKKKALTTFFLFFSPQLILQKSNGQFQRNLSFFKVAEGVQHFPGGGGVQLFPGGGGGGSNCLFPIETHITCDFPGGVRTPCPPLWIRT